jgi:predicted RNase H-related nuclease YkuK (DUF458 family)
MLETTKERLVDMNADKIKSPAVFDQNSVFITGSGQTVTLKEAVKRIKDYLIDVEDYNIIVGSDSQTNGSTKMITAIVVHRIGSGGIFFYSSDTYQKIHDLRARIYRETELSIACANQLIDMFLDTDTAYSIEIHSDIGVYGKTKELIREIVGYVTSMGFPCAIKPDAMAASTVADKFSK